METKIFDGKNIKIRTFRRSAPQNLDSLRNNYINLEFKKLSKGDLRNVKKFQIFF